MGVCGCVDFDDLNRPALIQKKVFRFYEEHKMLYKLAMVHVWVGRPGASRVSLIGNKFGQRVAVMDFLTLGASGLSLNDLGYV